MTVWQGLGVLLGCAAATYLTRMPALLLSGRIKIPPKVKRFMPYIGPSVIMALIAPAVFVVDGGLALNPLTNIYIGAAAVTAAVSLLCKKSLAAILAGIGAAFLLYLMKNKTPGFEKPGVL